MSYTAPIAEQMLVLETAAGIGELVGDRDLVAAIVEGAGEFAGGVFAPLNRIGDEVGAKWTPEGVTMPEGFAEAYGAYVEGGWGTLAGPEAFGGQGLPLTLATVVLEDLGSANMTHSDLSPAKIEPGVSVGQVLPPLVFDLALPVLTYFVLTGFGVAKLLALCAGGVFPALNIARTWIRSHRIQSLGVIVITFIAIGTAAALVSGSVFVALVKDFLLAGTFGLLCLGSLFVTPRPLMFYLLRQFIAGEDPVRLQWWESLWQRAPFRAALQRVTAIWGIGYVLQAVIGIACAWASSKAPPN